MKTRKAFLILAAAVAAGSCVYAEKVTLSATPPAVQQAIRARAGAQPIEDIDRDVRNGQVNYEASWKDTRGVQQELLLSESGAILRDVTSGSGQPVPADNTVSGRRWQPRYGTADANVPLSGGAKMAFDQAPPQVRRTVNHMANGASIEDFERGQWNGRTVYEAAFKQNGRHVELQVFEDGVMVTKAPAGTVTATTRPAPSGVVSFNPRYAGLADANVQFAGRERIGLTGAPASVQATVNQMANGAPIENFERGYWNGHTVYQAAFKQNGQNVELQILSDGSLLTKAPVSTAAAATANRKQSFFDKANKFLSTLNTPPAAQSSTASTVTLTQAPVAVQQTVNQVTKGVSLQTFDRGQWNGRTFYEAAFQENGQNMKLQVLDDGSILSMGPATAVGSAPSSVSGFGRQ